MKNKANLEPKQIQWYDERFYEFEFEEGVIKYIPSVTTKLGIINKPFLAKWRGDIGNELADLKMKQSQDRGSRIHSAWETMCKGGAVVFNPPRKPVYNQDDLKALQEKYERLYVIENQDEMHDVWKLQRFLEIVKPKILLSEAIVYDIENNDAGTMDNLLEIEEGEYQVAGKTPIFIKGGVYVADLKTGKSIDRSAYKQCACYAKCIVSMGVRESVDGTMILHTGSSTRTGIEGFTVHVRNKEDMEADYISYRKTSDLWEDENESFSPKVFSLPSLITYEVEK